MSAPLQSDAVPRQRRRAFKVFTSRIRFSVPSSLQTACANLMDAFFYFLGVFLVAFAIIIITGLTYSFFYVLLPMIQRANPNNQLLISLHVGFVLFLLVNIIANYFLCILAKHKGHLYETVVRELADATGFDFPETPQDILQYKKHFEERIIFRMQRRQARRQQELQQMQQPTQIGSSSNAVTNRKTSLESTSSDPSQQILMPIRKWLIMGPNEWGFCDATNQPKPPRSHFDHVTRQLVLNMDHYCPWMFNTVGYFNYRYFCNFLFFVAIAMIYGASITLHPFLATQSAQYFEQIRHSREHHLPVVLHLYDFVPTPQERSVVAFSFIMCSSVGLAVLVLCSFHAYLLLTGQTTIEFHVNCLNRRRAKRLRQIYKNPYDLGFRRNFQQVYGSGNPLWAILIPSNREPEFLPLPLPGKKGMRPSYIGKKDQDSNSNNKDGDENGRSRAENIV